MARRLARKKIDCAPTSGMISAMLRVAIYGLFFSGICVYVGQTIDPALRKKTHCEHGKLKELFKHCQFRILRWTDTRHACRIERQVIVGFKRRGQAVLNKRIKGPRPHYNGFAVKVESIRKPFISFIAASRATGAHETQIARSCRNGLTICARKLGKELKVKLVKRKC